MLKYVKGEQKVSNKYVAIVSMCLKIMMIGFEWNGIKLNIIIFLVYLKQML
jgi:hypothetical protein